MAEIDIYNTSAMQPPVGKETNFASHDSQASAIVITIVLCLAVSAFACGIRVFTKAYVMRQMQVEDYSLIGAEAFLAAYAALTLHGTRFGEGRHLWDVSIANAQEFANLGNIGEILYSPTMFFAKLSVLKQLERIFAGTRKDHIYWWLQGMIWLNASFYLSIFVSFICACVPREKLWNPSIKGTCINAGVSILATSGINIVSDWSILILPALVIHRLHMDTHQKIGVVAIFSVGLLACVASIVRLVYSIRFTQTTDETWAIAPVSIWSYVEIATVILSCSFPLFPKFVKFLRFGHQQPGTSHSNTTIRSRLKSGVRSERKRGYMLDNDVESRVDVNLGKQNHKLENRELDNLDGRIRKTVTVYSHSIPRQHTDSGQVHPW